MQHTVTCNTRKHSQHLPMGLESTIKLSENLQKQQTKTSSALTSNYNILILNAACSSDYDHYDNDKQYSILHSKELVT